MSRVDVDNSQDVIDSRDVIERLEELQAKQDAITDLAKTVEEAVKDGDAEELRLAEEELQGAEDDFAIKALAEESEGYADDWHHGTTLIRESYFVEYCQELCSEIGDLPKKIPSYVVIDWEATAENLKADYTAVEFGDVTYFVR